MSLALQYPDAVSLRVLLDGYDLQMARHQVFDVFVNVADNEDRVGALFLNAMIIRASRFGMSFALAVTHA